jgi:hypothetical protein
MSPEEVEVQEHVCSSCRVVVSYEPWPHPFDEDPLCTECLGALLRENEEADRDE